MTEAEIAELQKKAHAYDSEKGRLAKAQADLEEERRTRASLEQRLAQTGGSQMGTDPNALEVFGEYGLNYLSNLLSPVVGRLDQIGRKLEERDIQEVQAQADGAFWRGLDTKLSDSNLPGFAARLRSGDLAAKWAEFVEKRPSINRGQKEGDVETVSDAVTMFINQNKELVAGGGYSPNAVSGPYTGVKPDYTDADYMRDKRTLQKQLDNLVITEAVFDQKTAEIYGRYVTAQEKAEQSATAFGLV